MDKTFKPVLGIVAALLVSGVAGCGGGDSSSPTAPTSVGTTTPATTSGSSVTFSGTVTNIVTGVRVGGATVTIGSVSATSSADGSYSLAVTAAGQPAFSVAAPGYYTRDSQVSMVGSTTINPEIIPQGDGFDLVFFDWLFRENGTKGTARPTVIHRYEIWTRQVLCRSLLNDGFNSCERTEVIADNIPAHYEENLRNGLAQFGRLTGGTFANPSITAKTHPVGTAILRNDWLTANRTVSISYEPRGLWSDANNDGNDAYYSGEGGADRPAHIKHGWRAAADIGIVTHELAHSLGFKHPAGTPTQLTIMADYQGGYGITAADELHGRVLYKRPRGSLTPDRDPSGVTIN